MELLVAYDVATETPTGRRRLRRVAKICEGLEQRVLKSGFGCILRAAELELLEHRLRAAIEPGEDSFRIYGLREPRERFIRVMEREPALDIRDPLII
jgi:CRISPR-associated protein Cas2